MNNYYFIIFFIILSFSSSYSETKKSWKTQSHVDTKESKHQQSSSQINLLETIDKPKESEHKVNIEALKDDLENDEQHEHLENSENVSLIDQMLPFSDFVSNLYDNYKSAMKQEIKKKIRKNMKSKVRHNEQEQKALIDNEDFEIQVEDENDEIPLREHKESMSNPVNTLSEKREGVINYDVGPGVNVSLDVTNEVLKVKLDEDCLRDVFTGRAKKKQFLSKALGLFLLPFLIQSSFIPILLTAIKLLLMKSLVVGKIAILLLMIAFFKNQNLKRSPDVPYYLDSSMSAHHYSRRSESDGKGGYQVEGRPLTYIT